MGGKQAKRSLALLYSFVAFLPLSLYLSILCVKLDQGCIEVQFCVEVPKGDVLNPTVLPPPANDLIAEVDAAVVFEMVQLVGDVEMDVFQFVQQLDGRKRWLWVGPVLTPMSPHPWTPNPMSPCLH